MQTFSAQKEVAGWKGVVETRVSAGREPTRTRIIPGFFASEQDAINAARASVGAEPEAPAAPAAGEAASDEGGDA